MRFGKGPCAELSGQADLSRALHAGSPVDVARVVPSVAARSEGIVIDNRRRGTTWEPRAASAEPDGYTLLIGATASSSRLLYQNLDYDARALPVAMRRRPTGVVIAGPAEPSRNSLPSEGQSASRLRSGGNAAAILGESFKVVTAEIADPTKAGRGPDLLGGRIDMNSHHRRRAAADPAGQGPGAGGHHEASKDARRADHAKSTALTSPRVLAPAGTADPRQAQRRDQRSHARRSSNAWRSSASSHRGRPGVAAFLAEEVAGRRS